MIKSRPVLNPDGSVKTNFNPDDFDTQENTTLQLLDYANKYTNNTFLGTNTLNNTIISGTLSKGDISDSEFNYLDGLTDNIQIQLNNKNALINASNRLDVANISTGVVTSTEYEYLSGLTDVIQTQLNNKNALINSSNRLDVANISTGVVTNTEFNYLSGVTSSIQDQIDASLGNPNQPLNYYLIPHGPTTLGVSGFARTFVCDVTSTNCNFTFPVIDSSHDGMRFVISVVAATGTNVLFLTFSASSKLFDKSFTGATGKTLAIWDKYEIVCYDGSYYTI